jgi:septal ring factor EnvC (AmiA/AmiB activator)
MWNQMAIDLPHRGVPELQKVLNGLEGKLSGATARRDKIYLDVRRASAASDAGDQRQRVALAKLNKNSDAAGREVLAIEAQVAEARKRLAAAMNQADFVEAERNQTAANARDEAAKWFEVSTPDGRVIRHRAASLGALRGALLKGYVVTAEVFGASATGIGGVAAHIGSDVPTIMGARLAAHGRELEAWLTSHGVKSTAA